MVAENFAHALRAFSRRQPFKPFVVELVNGERIIIEHPEALGFNGGMAVYVSPRSGYTLFDHQGVADVRDLIPDASGS